MRKLLWERRVAIFLVIVLLLALGALYPVWFRWPRPIDSPFMERVHMVSEGARPSGVTDIYSYDLKDNAVAARESRKCRFCHGNMLQKEDGEPLYPIHDKMLKPITAKSLKKRDVSILELECVDCHKKVDMGKRTPEQATFRIDRGMCVKCHELQQKERLGTDTHPGAANAEDIGARNLLVNHGSDQESGRAWIVDHRRVAGVIGAVECRACHAFDSELDFCNECHIGWHPDDWKGSHPAAVKEFGIKRCLQCHVPDSKMDICSQRCHGASPLQTDEKQETKDAQ